MVVESRSIGSALQVGGRFWGRVPLVFGARCHCRRSRPRGGAARGGASGGGIVLGGVLQAVGLLLRCSAVHGGPFVCDLYAHRPRSNPLPLKPPQTHSLTAASSTLYNDAGRGPHRNATAHAPKGSKLHILHPPHSTLACPRSPPTDNLTLHLANDAGRGPHLNGIARWIPRWGSLQKSSPSGACEY